MHLAHSQSASQLYLFAHAVGFSQYFREKDQQEMWDYNDRKVLNKKYRALIDLWKKPLEKKRLRQARIKEIKASLPVTLFSLRSPSPRKRR